METKSYLKILKKYRKKLQFFMSGKIHYVYKVRLQRFEIRQGFQKSGAIPREKLSVHYLDVRIREKNVAMKLVGEVHEKIIGLMSYWKNSEVFD